MWESVVVLAAAIATLWQSAHTPEPTPLPPVSLTVAQVMALQPAALKAPITSLEGERAVYTAAWTALQDYLAAPFDPGTDTGLPNALEAVPLFGWDADLVRAPLRGVLPQITTPKEFAIAAYTVLRASDTALAKSHLPRTITNGNTPQGVFVVKGTVAATNRWIGPTPALQSKLPTEATVSEFEHAEPTALAAVWDESRYWSYLPRSWQGYAPLREAWLAGLAGRDEMWLRGDTVNPHYYRNASYFPYAPSAGCMVAIEVWSQADVLPELLAAEAGL